MSFYDDLQTYNDFDISRNLSSVTASSIKTILDKDRISPADFLVLLSPVARDYLEPIAERASMLTKKHFGNVIFLFTPLYISNYCDNVCPYCSFAKQHRIGRRQLSLDEIMVQAEHIAQTGMRNILVLTGESRHGASPSYIAQAIGSIQKKFAATSIEVYPMTQEEYTVLCKAGAEGFTMYQESYNEAVYHKLHQGGPKDDFRFRLEAPERAALGGMRTVTLGPLLGLSDPLKEVFLSGLHARYMQKKFPSVDISISFPRLRPMAGEFKPQFDIQDKQFVQIILAARLFLPQCGITVSTRESTEFRNAILNLGVTKMSAGVSTAVGGHGPDSPSTAQFEISDNRSLDAIKNDLTRQGFQPVLHDWNSRLFS